MHQIYFFDFIPLILPLEKKRNDFIFGERGYNFNGLIDCFMHKNSKVKNYTLTVKSRQNSVTLRYIDFIFLFDINFSPLDKRAGRKDWSIAD